MFVSPLGSAGIGLVWGWLVGSLEDRVRQPYRTVPAVALATLAIAAQVLWVLGWQGLAFFLGATLFAFLLHVGWHRELRSRFGLANPQ